ncbi:MAG: FAD/NAD(P)-binding oxidoreductase [Thermoanaerobaculia bacterium]
MANEERVSALVLGGGVGGLVAARRLRNLLPAEHRVVMVEREPRHVFAPSLLWVMTGDRSLSSISRSLARLERKGIEVVRGDVEEIDPVRRCVRFDGRTIAADFLVVALGADFAPELVPGLEAGGATFCTSAGAEAVRAALERFRGGRLVILTAAPAYKCPAAPYEAAMLLDHWLRRRGLRERTEIALHAAEPGPMVVAGPEVSAAVRAMVEERGVAYHPAHQIVEVDATTQRLRFSNGDEAGYDLLIHVPPVRSPAVARSAGLTAESGWIAVDRHSLATRFERVFAVGDVTGIPLKLGKPLPKAGVFAHAQAEVVARNIARVVTGRGDPAAFDGHGECFVETGNGRAGFGRGNFYAEPLPSVTLRPPARRWHAGKVLLEKSWLWRWF